MASLCIKFPAWPGWTLNSLTLSPTGPPTTIAGDSIIIRVDPSNSDADYNSDTPIFRGFWESANAASAPVCVLKFAMREDLIPALEKENKLYGGLLQTLQGSVVPRAFGLWTGLADGDRRVACLVLEYWGECLDQTFETLHIDLKIRILECLRAVHRKGLLHNDFAERNVLVYGGDVRLIDFDLAEAGHDCTCTGDFNPGGAAPSREDFGCPYLWDSCSFQFQLWS